MKEIELTKGYRAIVDDKDYEWINSFNWYCLGGKYAVRKTRREGAILMHRLILGASKQEQVDHVNRNGLDNRRANLRLCNSSQNMMNKKPKNSLSKYKGLSKNNSSSKAGWLVQVCKDYKVYNIGVFQSEIEAAKNYDKAVLYYHDNNFVYLNFPELIQEYKKYPYFSNKAFKIDSRQTSSMFRGVCKRKLRKSWSAQLSINNKVINIGHFENESDAARAYDKYVIDNNLLFNRKLNFPMENYV